MTDVAGILETALYVDDLAAATAFYRDVLGLTLMSADDRGAALEVGRGQVLLLLHRERSSKAVKTGDGTVPGSGATGVQHLAFRIEEPQLPDWERRLLKAGVSVESRVHWPRGGTSVYFRDPEGHSVEIAGGAIWPFRE